MIELTRTDTRHQVLALAAAGRLRRVIFKGLEPIWLDDDAALKNHDLRAINELWKLDAVAYQYDVEIAKTDGDDEQIKAIVLNDTVAISDAGRDLLSHWDGATSDIVRGPWRVEGSVVMVDDDVDTPLTLLLSNGKASLKLSSDATDDLARVADAIVLVLNKGVTK